MRYLILGSFTAKSLDIDPGYTWFYSSKKNQFWGIIEQVYSVSLSNKNSRVNFLSKLRIGISDIIYQCERAKENSSDNNLINVIYNPKLRPIISGNNIETIFFTSHFVENKFRRHYKDLILTYPNILLVTLPSPSPRYALMTKEEKVKIYKHLLPKQIATC